MSWTDENIQDLKNMVADKKTAKQIGEAIGKTRNAVIGKCHRLGLQFNSLTNAGRKRVGPLLKSDKAVLAQIKKHTDAYGWGLEFTEIVEFTKLTSTVVLAAVKSLLSQRYINKTTSYVADHVFFNDASVKQIGA